MKTMTDRISIAEEKIQKAGESHSVTHMRLQTTSTSAISHMVTSACVTLKY